ncbi:hypothetical protein [Nocardiopsis potens]|uniref:hypothetical protein n=1 Tax=Nocardiopsis potens TaxID=1246458 RepID=UPI00034AFF9F|nr:hypothetical protein [Nocardiopsis potens]
MHDGESGAARNTIGGDVGSALQAGSIIAGRISVGAPEPGPVPGWVRGSPRVAEADPLVLGVKRARSAKGASPVPEYVPRDIDARVRALLAGIAAKGGGLLLLRGASTAGKSRCLFEAVAGLLPEYRIIAPPVGEELDDLPEHLDHAFPGEGRLLWLDGMDRYLGPRRLTAELVARLGRARVPVVATVQEQAVDLLGIGAGYEVLNLAEQVTLARVWSEDELGRAEDAGDDRLVEAVRGRGPHGIAEYLAAAPVLDAEWRGAWRSTGEGGHPGGHALVAAAADLAAAGVASAIPVTELSELYREYLRGGAALRPEPFEEALEWALRHRCGVAGLLVPEDLEEEYVRPFDYLVDVGRARRAPEPLFRTALRLAVTDQERSMVGHIAFLAGHRDAAERAWDSVRSAFHVYIDGSILFEYGHKEAAERRWSSISEGHEELFRLSMVAPLMEAEGRSALSRKWVEMAKGNKEAVYAYIFGLLFLEREGREVDVDGAIERVVGGLSGGGVSLLCVLLVSHGELGRADRVISSGVADSSAMVTSGIFVGLGRGFYGEKWIRRAIYREPENVEFMYVLAWLLSGWGRGNEADIWLRRGSDAGDSRAAEMLGKSHEERRGMFDLGVWEDFYESVCWSLGRGD